MDMTQKISPHFILNEVVKSDVGIRLEIDNTPTREIIENAKAVAIHVLEPIRIHFGIPFSPNSWFRCEELEKEITKKSFPKWCRDHGIPINDESWRKYFKLKSHPRGEAVDIEIPGISNIDLFNWCKSNIPVYDQLILEFYKPGIPGSGWVHVSYSRTKNRMQPFVS